MNIKAENDNIIDETIKYTKEDRNYCSEGIAKREIAFNILRSTMLYPVPNIIAPVY
jgi:hypothetical protein